MRNVNKGLFGDLDTHPATSNMPETRIRED